MKTLKFVDGDAYPKIGILIKESAFKEQQLIQYYVQPMVDAGIPREEIVAMSLDYTRAGKAPTSIIKEYMQWNMMENIELNIITCKDINEFTNQYIQNQ